MCSRDIGHWHDDLGVVTMSGNIGERRAGHGHYIGAEASFSFKGGGKLHMYIAN